MGCEIPTVLNSRNFMEVLWSVRYYFYPMDQIESFPDKHYGSHSHSYIRDYPWLHEDEHDGEFHLHVEGIGPGHGLPLVMGAQAIVLGYYLVVTIVFVAQTSIKRRVADSGESLHCERLKLGLLFAPVMFCVAVVSVCTIYVTQNMIQFSVFWLDALRGVRRAYACTNSALALEFDVLVAEYEAFCETEYILIIVANVLLVISTPVQFVTHSSMMLRWYAENPKDGRRIARAIRVGIPL